MSTNCKIQCIEKGTSLTKSSPLEINCSIYEIKCWLNYSFSHKHFQKYLIPRKDFLTFVLSFVNRGHDFPTSDFRRQHNTDLSVRLCFDPLNIVQTQYKHSKLQIRLELQLLCKQSLTSKIQYYYLHHQYIQYITILDIITVAQHALTSSVIFSTLIWSLEQCMTQQWHLHLGQLPRRDWFHFGV